MTKHTTVEILQVGSLESTLAAEFTKTYEPLQLPAGDDRTAFLAEHADTVRVIITNGTPIDAELIAALPKLGAIVSNGVGYDAIDVEAARAHGVGLSNTPDVLTETVADTALGLTLMTLRQFGSADRYVRAGRWARDGAYPYTRDLNGLQVGILGLGRIGSAIAKRLLAFDCAIAYHNRHQVEGSPYRYAESLLELAESVDVLVVAAAGGKGTEKLVSREVLAALGPEGYLINIARGSVVDQDALIDVLASGELAGAGLDVFVDEPNVPERLRELENVVLLPHVGSATARTRSAMAQLTLRNLASYLSSGELVTPVLRPHR